METCVKKGHIFPDQNVNRSLQEAKPVFPIGAVVQYC